MWELHLPYPSMHMGNYHHVKLQLLTPARQSPALSYLSTFFNAMLIVMASKCLKSFPLLQRKDAFMGVLVENFPWFWLFGQSVCEQG